MSDLRDDLTDIRGVGDATADTILEVVENHDTGSSTQEIETAIEYLEDGHAGYALKYLRRVVE
jgi:hypothetical protein